MEIIRHMTADKGQKKMKNGSAPMKQAESWRTFCQVKRKHFA